VSALELMRDFYGVPSEKLELYPLGGFVPDDSEYKSRREQCRQHLALNERDILIVQSGKLDRSKKLLEALESFHTILDPELKFVIAGQLLPDIEEAVHVLVAQDPRITLLGWQSPEELQAILCAADVYCQPGTQSATMQMSVASRCAVILDDIPSHRPYMNNNGWLVGIERSLKEAFADIASDKVAVRSRGDRSYEVALRLLDYRLLAARLYR
jgi:1,2-diacylglycerol 3-alpha-glucosyltransferase